MIVTKMRAILVILSLICPSICPSISSFAQPGGRVAVTIDDLPVVSTRKDIKTRQKITRDIVNTLKRFKVPTIGFVNENKLYTDGSRDEAQVDLLRYWADAGMELGNHTYSHMSLHDNPIEKYEADILKGEKVTKEILGLKGKKPRYFRHPYLWTGLDLETKSGLLKFLSENGYSIAPVTIDNSDWIFARAYDNAIDKKDGKLRDLVGYSYVPYMERKVTYWEMQSKRLFDRQIDQILLIHANAINADQLRNLLTMFKQRKYKFISLEEALKDEAYRLPDTFTKRNGISWLHRWALAKGREFIVPDEPKTPEFVLKAAGVDSE